MIEIDNNSKTPVYEQIYAQLRQQIIAGELPKGSRLSPTRTFAKDYHLSRNTVLSAYMQLQSEGFIKSIQGSGFYVEELPEYKDVNHSEKQKTFKNCEQEKPRYDFRYGLIEPNIYNIRGFRKAMKSAWDILEDRQALYDDDPQGLFSLRQAICEHLAQERGVEADPRYLLITSGHHYSLQLITSLLSKDEYTFFMEEPGHQDSREVFRKEGYKVYPLYVDENGAIISRLKDIHNAIVYVTPSHQFPTGHILPIGRRMKLLEWARNNNGYIIEDDYDSQLRYKERPIPSLHSLDQNERVIYFGSFSKSLSSDLRVSYVLLPPALKLLFDEDRSYLNSSVSSFIQLTLSEYLHSGEYQRRINSIRNLYRKKHNLIIDFFKNNYDDSIKIYGAGGGTHLLLEIVTDLKKEEIIKRFLQNDIGVYPCDIYWADKTKAKDNQILIAYSGIRLEELNEYLLQMKKVLDQIINKSNIMKKR